MRHELRRWRVWVAARKDGSAGLFWMKPTVDVEAATMSDAVSIGVGQLVLAGYETNAGHGWGAALVETIEQTARAIRDGDEVFE